MVKPPPVDRRDSQTREASLRITARILEDVVISAKALARGLAVASLLASLVIGAHPSWADEASGQTTGVPAAAEPAPESTTELPETGDEATEHHRLAATIDREVEHHHRWVRGWRPYYYLHRLSKWADSLPAGTGLGYDFEFRLRRR